MNRAFATIILCGLLFGQTQGRAEIIPSEFGLENVDFPHVNVGVHLAGPNTTPKETKELSEFIFSYLKELGLKPEEANPATESPRLLISLQENGETKDTWLSYQREATYRTGNKIFLIEAITWETGSKDKAKVFSREVLKNHLKEFAESFKLANPPEEKEEE